MKEEVLLSIDMGGTEIKCALLDYDHHILTPIYSFRAHSEDGGFEEYKKSLENLFSTFKKIGEEKNYDFHHIGISTPGPFDFYRGVSLMNHKYSYLLNKNLGKLMANIGGLDEKYEFIYEHDAAAFLLGAIDAYDLYDHNVMGVVVGTGLGAVTYARHRIIRNDLGESADAIYYKPFKGIMFEDYVSARGIALRGQKMGLDVKSSLDVYNLAKSGNRIAIEVFAYFAGMLALAIKDRIHEVDVDTLIIGGAVSKSSEFFLDKLKEKLEKKDINVIIPDNQENLTLIGAIAKFRK